MNEKKEREGNLLILSGPSPSPPRMQVLTHLTVHFSAFLDLGRCILCFLLSSPDNICGTFDRVSPSCGGGGRISAEATDTGAIIVAAMAPNAAVDIQTVAAADLVTQQL